MRCTVDVKDLSNGEKLTQTIMEFVHFTTTDAQGARALEGWALSDKPLNDRR